jgi:hypothetical protein
VPLGSEDDVCDRDGQNSSRQLRHQEQDEIECQVRLRGGARDEFHLATYPPQNMK